MTKTKLIHLRPEQRASIYASMLRILRKEDNGFYKYIDDNDDSTVAAAHGVTEHQAKTVRLSMFGKLAPAHSFPKYGEVLSRLAAVEAKVAAMQLVQPVPMSRLPQGTMRMSNGA